MADPKTALDDAADTANGWWAKVMSYVPERWKRYVVLILIVAAVVWFILPYALGAIKDTTGYLYAPPQASEFEMKASGIMKAHADSIVDLDKRVDALEKAKAAQPPPLTTGSTNRKQR